MADYKSRSEKLIQFIENSPSAFHAIEELKRTAQAEGYLELKENEEWKLEYSGRYFVARNDSSLIAFHLPSDQEIAGFHMVASHSDSPTFKIKENPEMKVEDQYIKLNTEAYGGMILNTWLDRPLSVAGRITIKQNGRIVSRLVNINKDLLVIPNVAIHMNKTINSGMEYNAQTDMLPLFGQVGGRKNFMDMVAKAAGVKPEEILGHDLFLYVRDKGRVIGGNGEYILSPRLDDLQCAFSSMTALMESVPQSYVNICAVFDNEEVGSGTRQGADSTFLSDVLYRIKEALGKSDSWLRQKIADSLLISADNAHAVHPNHPEKADPTNRPFLNGGIVIKYHGSQKYTTDAYTSAEMKELCKEAGVPFQTYTNRSDIAGGSTLGNISTAHVSLPSVDIGLPQLAMHSAVETAGIKDTEAAINMMKIFYLK
ncbi:MAG TPA: M18 family aminopeptidase [Lachnospiraceae bacterium]|nr:M18 family aminopeptidase [Lachnospiraceae bacterium]